MTSFLGIVACVGGTIVNEDEQIGPTCYPPVRPALEQIKARELWEKAGPDLYKRLKLREAQIVSWALEMEVMLQELCEQP
jgi:hypothetical protein